MRKAPTGGNLHPLEESTNRIIAKVRAKVEHPFRVIKCQFGHVKTRYRGPAKNRAQLFTLFALGTCFWCGESRWHEDESAWKQVTGRNSGTKRMTRAAVGSEIRPRSAQAVIVAQPTALIRCSLNHAII
jgi:hypothetical protein